MSEHQAVSLTDNHPGHWEAKFVQVGKLGPDQVQDYAARKGMTLPEIECWLSPNLG